MLVCFVECHIVTKGTLGLFLVYFISTPVAFFFLFDIFIHLFFCMKWTIFLNLFIYFLEKKLLYFNGCYSTYCLMMVQNSKD